MPMKPSFPPLILACLLAGCTTRPPAPWESPACAPGELPPAVLPGTTQTGSATHATPVEPLTLDVQESVLMALQQNPAFRVERLQPAVVQTFEKEARSAFDPVLSATVYGRETDGEDDVSGSDALGATVAVAELLPTGTTLEAAAGRQAADGSFPPADTYDVRVTQALLRGLGTEVNLARLRQARLETQISSYELRGVAESLVAEVERAYWDCILAERAIAIFEKSVEIAEQAIAEANERIRVGALAETEVAAVEAELASRRESLINARSGLAKNRLALLRLISPAGPDRFTREIALTQSPEMAAPADLDDVRAHVELGFKQRADLNQARLAIASGELELVRTRNGTLPRLDLFVNLGGTRYAESFGTRRGDDWGREAQVGLAMEYPIGNRAAAAAHERAALSLEQAQGALANMQDLVEVDVRTAYLEVKRAEEQVKATEATRRLRSEALQTEVEKLRVGRSTSLMVAQASRDLVQSEIECLGAVIASRKALLDLYRLEGSLLERRGIQSADAK